MASCKRQKLADYQKEQRYVIHLTEKDKVDPYKLGWII
jgi:hypothetical protein